MIQECVSIILLFQISILQVKTNNIPVYNLHHVGTIKPHSHVTSHKQCIFRNKWLECVALNKIFNAITSFTKRRTEDKLLPYYDSRPYKRIRESNSHLKLVFSEALPASRRLHKGNPTRRINGRSLPDFHVRTPVKTHPMHDGTGYLNTNLLNQIPRPDLKHNFNNAFSTPHLRPHTSSGLSLAAQSAQVNSPRNITHNRLTLRPLMMGVSGLQQQIFAHKNMTSIDNFTRSLDNFERRFYEISFTKLTTISPVDRQENGMSFVQSSFFLLLTLMTLSKEVDYNTSKQIDQSIGFKVSDMDSVGLVKHFITTLPSSSDKLKLRQSSRLMLWPGRETSPEFQTGSAAALQLHVERFNGTETAETIASILNQKVERDSGGAIHDTFDEDDVSRGVTAVLVTTLYVRGSWRAAPTVLNGTRPFRDADNAPKRAVRMIRINDIMTYADLTEWDAQALEISYATPGLTLLMLIPRNNSLRSLVQHVCNTSIAAITANMTAMRVAATIPIYTLRMTLLLPNKLQAMGIPGLIDISNVTQGNSLKLSHAVQRIMFWAEAGRNAYKDDGIEWDTTPELEVVVDRPYIFFVRWRNVTLINGNFVL